MLKTRPKPSLNIPSKFAAKNNFQNILFQMKFLDIFRHLVLKGKNKITNFHLFRLKKRSKVMKKNLKIYSVLAGSLVVLFLTASVISAQNCPNFLGAKSKRQSELLNMVDNKTFMLYVKNKTDTPITVRVYHSRDETPGKSSFKQQTVAPRTTQRIAGDAWFAGDWGVQINDSCIRYMADVGTTESGGFLIVTYASEETTCKSLGYTEPARTIDGVWNFEHSSGLLVHQATLYMSDGNGKVITKFFDEDTNKTKVVEQKAMLCQSSSGLMVLGTLPMDFMTGITGEAVKYDADNFSMKKMPNGSFEIFSSDENGGSKADFLGFRELNTDDENYINRTYF